MKSDDPLICGTNGEQSNINVYGNIHFSSFYYEKVQADYGCPPHSFRGLVMGPLVPYPYK